MAVAGATIRRLMRATGVAEDLQDVQDDLRRSAGLGRYEMTTAVTIDGLRDLPAAAFLGEHPKDDGGRTGGELKLPA